MTLRERESPSTSLVLTGEDHLMEKVLGISPCDLINKLTEEADYYHKSANCGQDLPDRLLLPEVTHLSRSQLEVASVQDAV